MADRNKRKLDILERRVGRWAIGGDRVASPEPKRWVRQAWNMAEEKRLWANKVKH